MAVHIHVVSQQIKISVPARVGNSLYTFPGALIAGFERDITSRWRAYDFNTDGVHPQSFLDQRNQPGDSFEVAGSEVLVTSCPDPPQRFVDVRAQPLLELSVLREFPDSERQLMNSYSRTRVRIRIPFTVFAMGSWPANRILLREGQPTIPGEHICGLLPDFVVGQPPIQSQ